MSENDRIILNAALDQERAAVAPELPEPDFFETFVSEQVLKDYDLSGDEIRSGIVDGTRDGGIDGLYLFANGDLVQEDTDISQLKKGVHLEMVITQATTSSGFSETRVERLRAATEDLLDLSKGLDGLAGAYNEGVRAGMALFRSTYQTLAARFPQVLFRYVLASKAIGTVHQNVLEKAEKLEATVKKLFSHASCQIDFLGSSELLALARRSPKSSYSLNVDETISTASQVGFVCLVRLADYYAFITEQGALQRHLFEANVRDYQGATEVNQQIRQTLAEGGPEDFWWLNNGISIIATRAVLSGKNLTVEDPQIVNGLQTSSEVYSHFNSSSPGAHLCRVGRPFRAAVSPRA